MIREVVKVILRYNDHSEQMLFAVTKLGGYTTILGYHIMQSITNANSVSAESDKEWPMCVGPC